MKTAILTFVCVLIGTGLTLQRSYCGDLKVTSDEISMRVLFEFVDESEASRWLAVNDNVMGGVSEGRASLTEDSCLLFSGTLSLENNGGFASIRTGASDFGLDGYYGLRIRVKGDGRTYQFRLRRDRYLDGIAFRQEFKTTDNSWIEVDLPFDSFVPTYRGRTLRDVDPLDAADIRQLGFLLADKQPGEFHLIIDRIVALRQE